MAFLKDFSPQSTRKNLSRNKHERPESNSGVRVSSAENHYDPQLKKEEIKKEMIEAYTEEINFDSKKEEVALQEQLPPNTLSFNMFDLSFKCHEFLRKKTGILHIKGQKLYNIQKDYYYKKIQIYADKVESISHGFIKDELPKYKTFFILPEEFFDASGILRKYFGINEVAILYNTGELLLRESKYCNFWLSADTTDIHDIFESSNNKILDGDKCLICPFNFFCDFAQMNRKQQIAN